MKSIERYHTNLVHATPHKLHHADAPLAKQSSMSLGRISDALTHVI